LVILQDTTDLVDVQGLCTEIRAYESISIKTEVLSDVEEEKDPLAMTLPVIKAEPEVSCVSVLGQFH
jgi:hypothetical protein